MSMHGHALRGAVAWSLLLIHVISMVNTAQCRAWAHPYLGDHAYIRNVIIQTLRSSTDSLFFTLIVKSGLILIPTIFVLAFGMNSVCSETLLLSNRLRYV